MKSQTNETITLVDELFYISDDSSFPQCDRCGEPALPDGIEDPVTGLIYCDICYDDLFH